MATRKKKSSKRKHRPCGNALTGGTLVQSLVFSKERHARGKPPWTAASSRKWARAHGYVAPHVEEAVNTYRVRQFAPQGREAGRAACGYRAVPYGRSGITGVVEFNPRRRRR